MPNFSCNSSDAGSLNSANTGSKKQQNQKNTKTQLKNKQQNNNNNNNNNTNNDNNHQSLNENSQGNSNSNKNFSVFIEFVDEHSFDKVIKRFISTLNVIFESKLPPHGHTLYSFLLPQSVIDAFMECTQLIFEYMCEIVFYLRMPHNRFQSKAKDCVGMFMREIQRGLREVLQQQSAHMSRMRSNILDILTNFIKKIAHIPGWKEHFYLWLGNLELTKVEYYELLTQVLEILDSDLNLNNSNDNNNNNNNSKDNSVITNTMKNFHKLFEIIRDTDTDSIQNVDYH